MAGTEPYMPGRAASTVVGTPGLDRSAGAGYRTLASGLTGLREEAARTRQIQQYNIVSGIESLAKLVAQKAADAAQKRKAQDAMLEDVAVADDLAKFEQDADRLRRDRQDRYMDRPQEAEDGDPMNDLAWKDELSQMSEGLREKYRNSPRAMTKLVPSLNRVTTSQLDQMGSWVRTRRTAQAQQLGDKTVQQTVMQIAESRGTTTDKVNEYRRLMQQVNGMDGLFDQLEPALGTDAISLKRLELQRKAGPALYNNMMASLPDESEEALRQLDDVRWWLDNNNDPRVDIYLDADDKVTLQGHVEKTENKYLAELSNDTMLDEMTQSMDLSEKRFNLDLRRNDDAYQNQGIQWAAQQAREIKARAELIRKDARLPKKAKLQIIRSLDVKIGKLDTVVKTAHANLRFNETLRKQGQAEARREYNEWKREQEKAAREQLKQSKDDALTTLNDLKADLRSFLTDPTGNRQLIIDTSARIKQLTETAGRAGYLTPAQTLAGQRAAYSTFTQAAKFKTEPQFGIGFLKFGPEQTKPVKDKAEQKQIEDQYKADMLRRASEMAHEEQQVSINKLAGMNDRQQQVFSDSETKVRERARAENWTSSQLNLRLNQIRNEVMRTVR